MQISGYGLLQQLDPNAELEQVRRQRQMAGLDETGSENKGDTVSFSTEGRRLAAQMLADKADAQTESGLKASMFGTGSHASAGTEKAAGSVDQGEGAQGGGSGGSDDSGSDSEAQDIEEQIKALQSQLQSVLGGSLPDDLKQVTAQPIQQQIVQLQQQLTQLKAQAAKG